MSSAQQQSHKANGSETTNTDMTADNTTSLKRETSWPSVLFYIHLHILGLYGLLTVFRGTLWLTIFFSKRAKNNHFLL